jgi:hypothetical protein
MTNIERETFSNQTFFSSSFNSPFKIPTKDTAFNLNVPVLLLRLQILWKLNSLRHSAIESQEKKKSNQNFIFPFFAISPNQICGLVH